MDNEKIIERIAEIEREIAVLPAGCVSKKNVHGKVYYYHRITQNGKRMEKYVKAEDVDELKSNIEKRKKLEKFNISLKSLHYCAKLSSCEIFSSSGGNHERTGDQRQAAAFLREELRYRKAVRSKRPYIRCLCKLPRERRKIRALKESRAVEDQLS